MNVFYKVKNGANILFIIGAVFFVLSDSLLAINKFYHPFWGANISIMLTYGIAQFCIVKGYLTSLHG
jgi:uncharacterized membrane protein YhhN